MTTPDARETVPPFRAAIRNRTVQIMIGGLVALGAAAAAAAVASDPGGGGTVTTRAQVEAIVREYILAHPEILPEAMQRLQAKQVGSTIEEQRAALETPFGSAWEGAEKGDVVLVEFFDYACGYCRASLPDIDKLIAADSGVKVVYRELPILSEQSEHAARVSLLAAQQGKFSAYHDALYAAGQVTPDSIAAAARSVGIDRKAIDAAMKDAAFTAEIEKNVRMAQAIRATGTPTFVVGGQMLEGAVGYDRLKAAVDQARKR